MRSLSALSAAALSLAVIGCTGGPGGGESQGTSPTGGAGGAQQAVQQCEQSINAAPQLSGDVKAKLEKICARAASGDEKAVRDATKQVCRAIVKESVPAGPARREALGACRRGP